MDKKEKEPKKKKLPYCAHKALHNCMNHVENEGDLCETCKHNTIEPGCG